MKEEYLEWLLKLNNNKEFIVQRLGKRKSQRIWYPSGRYQIKRRVINFDTQERTTIIDDKVMPKTDMVGIVNQRQVMPFEILFDIDYKGTNSILQSNVIGRKIIEALKQEGLKATLWWSGNMGHHVHVFILDMLNMSVEDRKLVRKYVLKKIMIVVSELHKNSEYGKYIDKLKTSESTLIQLEFAPHRKTLNIKSPILDDFKRVYKYNINIPVTYLDNITKEKIRHIISENNKISSFNNSIKEFDRKCITYFLKHPMDKGNRDNMFFAIVSVLKFSITKQEVIPLMRKYRNMNDCFIPLHQMLNKIEHIFDSKRGVSCRYLKNILEESDKKYLCEGCIWNGI